MLAASFTLYKVDFNALRTAYICSAHTIAMSGNVCACNSVAAERWPECCTSEPYAIRRSRRACSGFTSSPEAVGLFAYRRDDPSVLLDPISCSRVWSELWTNAPSKLSPINATEIW